LRFFKGMMGQKLQQQKNSENQRNKSTTDNGYTFRFGKFLKINVKFLALKKRNEWKKVITTRGPPLSPWHESAFLAEAQIIRSVISAEVYRLGGVMHLALDIVLEIINNMDWIAHLYMNLILLLLLHSLLNFILQ
jgi:hypothetical protein